MTSNSNLNFKKYVVNKPWGCEYIAYQNKECSVGLLKIKKQQETSLHCHPKKKTGLILIDGEAEVELGFYDKKKLISPSKIMIRPGLFHSTKCISKTDCTILEIESPVNKMDLVRFKDSYGREGKPYEDETFEIPKAEDCLWIKNDPKVYNFAKCIIDVKNITDINEFIDIDDSLNVMFLKGGLLTDYDQKVAGPGDIVLSSTIKELTEVFKKVDPSTLVMIIKQQNG